MLNLYLPPDFDWKFYLDANPDLRANGIYTPRDAAKHYIEFGKKENRIYCLKDDFTWNLSKNFDSKVMSAETEKNIITYEKICKKYLSLLPSIYPTINKYSTKKSLIVETRWNDMVEFSIKNTIQKLGNDWGHIIVCNNQNINQIEKLKETISDQIEIINLGDSKINQNSYNNLLLSLEFWEKIECEKILIYQHDTFIFKKFDNQFIEWDYIGSPWGPSEYSENIKTDFGFEKEVFVGNGGLSLRSVLVMKNILKTCNVRKIRNYNENYPTEMENIPEDVYFSYHIENNSNYKLAPLKVAKTFSYEHLYSDDTFGCHKPFIISNIDLQLFEKFLKKLDGINVLGYGNNITGLGHNMRMIVSVLRKLKIPHNVNIINTHENHNRLLENDDTNFFNTNLILCNPESNLNNVVGSNYFKNKYNIALWAWELEMLPQSWKDASKELDEIWTISDFCKQVFERDLTNKKIEKIHIPGNFLPKMDKSEAKRRFRIEDKFVCLFVFDASSDINRKNPSAVIQTFKKSLGNLSNTLLIIKGQNLTHTELSYLKSISNNNIIIYNEIFNDEKMQILFNCADIYISLHRSEGSGLTIMEAINLEIPTVTTNYSGNLDFCDENCSLVDYKPTLVDAKHPAYREIVNKTTWAEPNVDDAVKKLFDIYYNYEIHKSRILLTKNKMVEKFSFYNLCKFFSKKFIQNDRDRSSFFFIHVYKNLGTTIHKQLPKNYNRRFYGRKTLKEWEEDCKEILDVTDLFSRNDKISIDHIKINKMFKLGIIDDVDVENRKFLGIVREPLDRFISICNFEKISPNELLNQFNYKKHTQTSFFKTDLPIDLTLITMENKNLIVEWFRKFEVEIDLNRYLNVSEKKFKKENLTQNQIERIKNLFFDDFVLYDKIKNSSGLIEMKGFKL